MKDSILTDDFGHCFFCGSDQVHRHHIFFGKNRKNSDEDGLWIPLCYKHHNGSNDGVHSNHSLDTALKLTAQCAYEKTHTRNEFIARYGKSYL